LSLLIFALFVLILILISVSLSHRQHRDATVVRCLSKSCKFNEGMRCTRLGITIYDNEVTGLCVEHTDDMLKRLSRAYDAAIEVCLRSGNIVAITKRDKDFLDEIKAIKDIDEFNKLMKRHGI